MNRKIFRRGLIAAFMLALALSSCAKKNPAPKTGTKIAATFYPLYIMLMNICGGAENVELSLLAPPDTGCLHDYQFTTRDMKAVEGADIIVANGSGMETFIEKILSQKENVILASDGFRLEDGNPHVWVSVEGAIFQTKKISEALAEIDPKNSAAYRKNSEAYIARLAALQDKMRGSLEKFRGKKIVTFHEAFPYFAREFGLEVAAVIEREPGSVPSAREMASLISELNGIGRGAKKIPLFVEPQYSPASAKIISEETGLEIFTLDPCATGAIDKDAYINSMEENLRVLESALSEE